jgi:PHD-finger
VGAKNDIPHTRHRQRGRDDDENDEILKLASEEYDFEDGDEEEITRCICGQQDYPGLPPKAREAAHRSITVKSGIKDELANSTAASDILSEDAGSLFIQCDSCKVWQHGGCVGIMDEAMTPDEYFCEECRKDLHKIVFCVNG